MRWKWLDANFETEYDDDDVKSFDCVCVFRCSLTCINKDVEFSQTEQF